MDKAIVVQSAVSNSAINAKTKQLAKWSFYRNIPRWTKITFEVALVSIMLALPAKAKAADFASPPPHTITYNRVRIALASSVIQPAQDKKKSTGDQRKDRQLKNDEEETVWDKLDVLGDKNDLGADRIWRFFVCYPVIILVGIALLYGIFSKEQGDEF